MWRLASGGVVLALAITGVVFSGCPVQTEGNPAIPVALFDARPASGHPPLEVQFTDQSRPGATPIEKWCWDFGDGTNSYDPNPRHEYYLVGNYTVSLTVTSSTGANTVTKNNCVQLMDTSTVAGIGPAGGAITVPGATLTVPVGALSSQVVIVIAPKQGTVPLNYSENDQLVSDVFTISHDQSDDLHSDSLKPMQLKISFMQEMVPANTMDGVHLQVIAQLDNGVAIPILGVLDASSVSVNICGLPQHAAYGVVVRPLAVVREVEAGQSKEATGFQWPVSRWRWCYTPATLNALTALHLASIYAPDNFDRRDWDSVSQKTALADTESTIVAIHQRANAAGFMSPALVPTADKEFTLVFYPMNSPTVTSYTNVTDLTYATSLFGNVTIDPAQLDTISKLNAGLGEDQAQKLDLANAFSGELFHAIFRGYDLPLFTQESALDLGIDSKPRLLPYFKGFEDSIATYVGQVDSQVTMARTLGSNEVALLSEPLLAPFAATGPGYSYASQDFLFYVDKRFTSGASTDVSGNGPVGFIADSYLGTLELMRRHLTEAPVPTNFDDALTASRRGLDMALQNFFSTTLPQVFWDYTKARAYENDDTSQLRPSDLKRAIYTLNNDRFETGTVFEYAFTVANEVYEISGAEDSALAAVPPLSTRAVVLDADGTFGDLTIEANSSDWVPDAAGNSVMIKAYKNGKDGTELIKQVVLSNFGNPMIDGFTQAIILISNVTLDRTYPVTIKASLNTVTGAVRGRVVLAGPSPTPLPGVSVRVTRDSDSTFLGSATTDTSGNFTVSNLQPGNATVTFKETGFNTATSEVAITGGQTAVLSVEMIPIVLP